MCLESKTSNIDTWRPGASLDVLEKIAALRDCIRSYMQEQDVLEVVTPALSQAASTDPNIHSFAAGGRYLHTSPEFPMKRLLCAYARDIYQIANVFRDGEVGRHHNAEFSLLEWYRVGMDHHALMNDVEALMQRIVEQFSIAWVQPQTIRYTDAVSRVCEKPFDEVTIQHIENVFRQHQRYYPAAIGNDLDAAMDLLMDEFVVSQFEPSKACFIVDYPASQAALARVSVDKDGYKIAERFELFWGPVELANGFHELVDAGEQRARFIAEQQTRNSRDQSSTPMDEHLLQALSHGLPDCAGVALGLDRLMLVLTGCDHIDQVQAFAGDRA